MDTIIEPGHKPIISAERAVCSSSHPHVTDTMIAVMRDGGNAVDAVIAGSLIQAVVEPHMTNHAGTVTCLVWNAESQKPYQLDAMGTLVSGQPPVRPVPGGKGFLSPHGLEPSACIPGFMPGLGALHERFGSVPWETLCQPAIEAAEHGFVLSSFQYGVLVEELPFNTYFLEGRELFMPDGFMPCVGERFFNKPLAQTLRHLADEGVDYFTTGQWARHFVDAANEIGWNITLEHMTAVSPRWVEPLRFPHGDYEIVQQAPPQRTGVFTALVLGILKQLDIAERPHFTESAETLYFWAHALRRAEQEMGWLHDPHLFGSPVEQWLSPDYHRAIANILRESQPKVDLSEHVRLTFGQAAMRASGNALPKQPVGSCELSVVDGQGNWVQLMSTLQSGGIPGMVVDGVNMVGSHARPNMRYLISGWLTGNGRIKNGLGNTIILKDNKPVYALGTPGNVHVTTPQVISNLLDYGMSPDVAVDLPRMLPLADDYTLLIENRLPQTVIDGMTQRGIFIHPHLAYDYHMGSYQLSWWDAVNGTLCSLADARRAGKAAGF